MQDAFEKFKELCDKKKDIFDEDIYAIIDEQSEQPGEEAFHLEYVGFSSGTATVPTATVKVRQGGELLVDAGTGDGPVDAVFQAIQRITGVRAVLKEYSLEAITGGMDAQGQVSVTVEIDGRTVKARGASTDVVMASARAYMLAINKHLAAKSRAEDVVAVPKEGM